MERTLIELNGVVVESLGRTRLEGCSLTVRTGEILGVIGGSGTGKSTLLEVLAGRLGVQRGNILHSGRDITRNLKVLKDKAALVGHQLDGPYDVSPKNWLQLWAELDGVPEADRKKRIASASSRFGVDMSVPSVRALSRGQQRRLSIARAWSRRPEFLILDQPGDVLDGEGLRLLSGSLKTVVSGGTTIVFADASPQLPLSICDRVVALDSGRVVGELSRGDENFEQGIAGFQGWLD